MNLIERHTYKQNLLSRAREAALDKHNGIPLSAAAQADLDEALYNYGAEEVYMDGELFYVTEY